MDKMPFPELIKTTKESVLQAKDELLKTFAFVPEDKLHWSPSATARTPVWMVAHCGASNRVFATILRGEPVPLPPDPDEAATLIREGGHSVKTRSEAVESIEDSSGQVLSALDAVTPEMLATSPDSPFGPIPFLVWMQTPAAHMSGHKSQLEYLQTIWGDVQTH